MVRLGDFELHAVRDGFFKLDGGAMFGIVPKPVWSKVFPCDDQNRITLSLTALLVRNGEKNILIDDGIGGKFDERSAEMYGIVHDTDICRSLARIGLTPGDIHMVVLTHLHFDHAGGSTVRGADGRVVPTFPNAEYVVQESAWEEATKTDERTKGSYRPDDFLPLKEAGQLRLIRGDVEVAKGIRVRITGGHLKCHEIVFVESRGATAVYFADIIPTTRHVRPPWIMGYDLYPQETLRVKKELVAQAVEERWLCVWEHDPDIAMGYIRSEGKEYRIESVEKVS